MLSSDFHDKKKVIHFQQATLDQLDAGTVIAYPKGKNGEYRYYAVPGFLIIGVAKGGTRELLNWLGRHPNLQAMSKEVNFFDDVINIEQEWQRYVLNPHFLVSKSREHLEKLQKQTFEKTPAYFHKENRGQPVPAIAKKMMPSGKFIAILRNPADRAYSAFQMGKRALRIRAPSIDSSTDFDDYLDKNFGVDTDSTMFKVGKYAQHLNNWLKCFSRDQLLVVFSEDFKKKPFELMAKVQSFLQIPFFDYAPLAKQLPNGFWVLQGQRSKAYSPTYEPMSDMARSRLNEYYAPWNEQLRQLFPDITLPW
ncbi:MAG: sulfotransferase domain-containing protein [Pseudomonadota bacterium]